MQAFSEGCITAEMLLSAHPRVLLREHLIQRKLSLARACSSCSVSGLELVVTSGVASRPTFLEFPKLRKLGELGDLQEPAMPAMPEVTSGIAGIAGFASLDMDLAFGTPSGLDGFEPAGTEAVLVCVSLAFSSDFASLGHSATSCSTISRNRALSSALRLSKSRQYPFASSFQVSTCRSKLQASRC